MPPIALTATPADLEILTGEWAGEYESAALGRRGSIEFKLKAGTNEARGDVPVDVEIVQPVVHRKEQS